MLFNPKKPFKILEVTKGDYTCYHIQQPINFFVFTLWRTIKYRTVEGIYITKAFDKLKNALNWIDEKKQPIEKNVVYDSRKCIPDFKGKIPPPPTFFGTKDHQLIDRKEDYETPGGLD